MRTVHLAVFDGDYWGSACGWAGGISLTGDVARTTCKSCIRSMPYKQIASGNDTRFDFTKSYSRRVPGVPDSG